MDFNYKMKRQRVNLLVILFLIVVIPVASSQSSEKQGRDKIKTLNSLIKKLEKRKVDVQKERMTIRTAEVFFKFANWDEQNVEINKKAFQQVSLFKNNASKLASDLPEFERNEINLMLDQAIENAKSLLDKKVFRQKTPTVDWSKVSIVGDQLVFNNKPVFLSDYTWKPDLPELNQYFGDLDGYFLTPTLLINGNGEISPKTINDLQNKPDGNIGFIFMNHKNVPKWALDKYPDFETGKRLYTEYDIDNPGAREMESMLIKGTVPFMAGKKYTELGYMLCNEPHWNTIANAWESDPVSEFTIEKFKIWLKNKHKDINSLNKVWGTNFPDFNSVQLDIPIAQTLQGTPEWYDWMSFNMSRVTDWFTFLKNEVRKYDPKAKVHLKVIPNMWAFKKVDHGLDFEALTELSDIIGNDASSADSYFRANDNKWKEKYIFDWRELATSYDFFKSVSPDKIIFNSEGHFLTTTKSRDLYLKPEYARAAYWLAHMEGLNACQTWYWARKEDGSIKNPNDKGYAGSNNQQPRIINEVASTMMDLNANSEAIAAMQRMPKPIRVFYSKTSAIQNPAYMDDIFPIYESLYFEGISMGYATKNIIEKQNNRNWEVILVSNTEFVTAEELNALQNYLNNGGTVITDSVSLKKNEYGQTLPKLSEGNGKLITVSSLAEMHKQALSIVEKQGLLPEININEKNASGVKNCVWRSVRNSKGNIVLSVLNLGVNDATLKVVMKNQCKSLKCKDLIKGIAVSSTPVLRPYEVYFVEISQQ